MIGYFSLYEYLLWFFSIGLKASLLVAMWRHRTMRQHLPFFRYIAFQVAASVILLGIALWSSPLAYAWGYWIDEALDLALLLRLIHAMFQETFSPHESLPSGVLTAFAFGVSMFLVAAVDLLFKPAKGYVWWMTAIRVADRSTSVMLCGLILCTILFGSVLGLPRPRPLIGFAVSIIVGWLKAMVVSGGTNSAFIRNLHMLGALASLGVWHFSLCNTAVPKKRPSKVEITSIHADFTRYCGEVRSRSVF